MRAEAHVILGDLRAAMMMLDSTQSTLKKITTQLSECGFAGTRREIAGKLKVALQNLQCLQDDRRKQRIDSKSMDALLKELMTIEGQTPRIMSIVEARALPAP